VAGRDPQRPENLTALIRNKLTNTVGDSASQDAMREVTALRAAWVEVNQVTKFSGHSVQRQR
jgi:hypothetical protein